MTIASSGVSLLFPETPAGISTSADGPEHELGTLWHQADGSIYKYCKIDFGSFESILGAPYQHIVYAWYPWNGIACQKMVLQ